MYIPAKPAPTTTASRLRPESDPFPPDCTIVVPQESVVGTATSVLNRTSNRPVQRARSPQRRVRSPAGPVHGLPAVASDDRAVGTEPVAQRLKLARRGRRLDRPREPVAHADAEVVDGPDVEAAELE